MFKKVVFGEKALKTTKTIALYGNYSA